jgi:hypothetical protein
METGFVENNLCYFLRGILEIMIFGLGRFYVSDGASGVYFGKSFLLKGKN